MHKFTKKSIIYLKKIRSPNHYMIIWDIDAEWWSFRKMKTRTNTMVEEHCVCYNDLGDWLKSMCNTQNGWEIAKKI